MSRTRYLFLKGANMNGRVVDLVAILAVGGAILAVGTAALNSRSCITGLEGVQSELRALREELAKVKAAPAVAAPVAPPKAPDRDINIFNLERR